MKTRKQTIPMQTIPMQTRKAQFVPDSVNAESRTATMVWTTGAAVRRFDWWEGRIVYEELSLAEGHVHMDRLNNGAPLLNSHEQRDLSDIVGVVERAWIEDGLGHAEVRFSERADVEPIFRDVQSGIIRNVSVGYMVHKYETVSETEDGTHTIRAVDWTPAELSIVPVPADAGAGIRSLPESDCEFVNQRADSPKEPEMSKDNPAAQPATETKPEEPKVDLEKIRAVAVAEDRARAAEINKLCARHGMQDLSTGLIESGAAVEEVRAKILDELAERDAKAPTMPRIEAGRDESESRREGMEEYILYRTGHGQMTEKARPFSGLTMLEMARKSLEANGVRATGMDKMPLAARAMHTTSDFPEILANVANKTLRAAYEGSPRTHTTWCRRSTAPDFKQINRTQMGDSPTLVQVNEHGEYTYGTVGEMAEKYALATYGRIVSVTRQAIVNDDLSAFERIIPGFGRAAADLERATVYGILNANAAMADGVDLFHADHGNLDSAAVISVESLGDARARMRKQTGINGQSINVEPRFLIVPAALETVAQQYTSNAHVPDPSSNINPFASTLEVIVDPVLDETSASHWYLAADYSQVDTIEYAYLEGNEGVYIETRNGFEVDGVEIKARLDFAAKAIDHRGLYRNG